MIKELIRNLKLNTTKSKLDGATLAYQALDEKYEEQVETISRQNDAIADLTAANDDLHAEIEKLRNAQNNSGMQDLFVRYLDLFMQRANREDQRRVELRDAVILIGSGLVDVEGKLDEIKEALVDLRRPPTNEEMRIWQPDIFTDDELETDNGPQKEGDQE